jgi:hypothetical protein
VSWLSKLFRRAPAAPLTSSVIYTAQDALAASGGFGHVGSTHVAQVRAAALPGLYSHFRDELFRLGIVRWNERFDCNQFAALYIALANARFYAANFHAETPAQSLALAEYWYRPGGSGNGHAIVLALTDRGPLFIEPQTGALLYLNPAEITSRYLVKF